MAKAYEYFLFIGSQTAKTDHVYLVFASCVIILVLVTEILRADVSKA